MCEYYVSLKICSVFVILFKIIGTSLHLAATALPHWLSDANVTVGFFHACTTGSGCTNFEDFITNAGKLDLDISGRIQASKVLAIFAVIIGFGTLFLSFAEVLMDHVAKRYYKVRIIVPIFSLGLAVLSFLFILVCAIMMKTTEMFDDNTLTSIKVEHVQQSFKDFQVGYSLIMSVCGGVLIAVGGLLSAIRERRSRAFKQRQSKTTLMRNDESTVPTYAEQDTSGRVDVTTNTIGQIGEAAVYYNGQVYQRDKDKSEQCPNTDNATDKIEFKEIKPDWAADDASIQEVIQ